MPSICEFRNSQIGELSIFEIVYTDSQIQRAELWLPRAGGGIVWEFGIADANYYIG